MAAYPNGKWCRGSVLLLCIVLGLGSGEVEAGAAPARYSENPFSRMEVAAAWDGPTIGSVQSGSSPCFLVILADAQGFDYSSPKTFLKTMRKHPRGGKNERSVGHSWLILNGPLTWLECGHTGEFDEAHPDLSQSIRVAIERRDPNPLACLWTNQGLGHFEVGSGGHLPTVAVRFDLSTNQYAAIRAFVEDYDFKNFNPRNRVCTHFVIRAAASAGLTLGHQVTLTIPPQTRFMGREIRWWTDPLYSRLTFGSPDVLEKSLELAVQKGIGKNVLKLYQK